MSSLKTLTGIHKGAVFALRIGENTIGRDSSCDIFLHDEGVSSRHAVLVLKDGGAQIRDLESRNGIFINEKRTEETTLDSGDQILLGSSLLEFDVSTSQSHDESDFRETVEILLNTEGVERLTSGTDAYSKIQIGARGPEALCRLAYSLSKAESQAILLSESLKVLSEYFNVCATSAFLPDRQSGALESGGSHPAHDPPVVPKMIESTVKKALDLHEAILLKNRSMTAESTICAPLMSEGVIILTGEAGQEFSETDLRFAALASHLISMALTTMKVNEEAISRSNAFEQQFRGQFEIVGESAPIRKVFEIVERVAPTDSPVLICGETGTGKELVAHAIHARNSRASGPFVTLNCAAIPSSLLEASLFGHVKGAFTGADQERKGCFQQADGGTLFLDEIAELTLEAQAKLLRIVEDGVVQPVGSDEAKQLTTRLIFATHQDLADKVKEKLFREDLYFRLNIVQVTLPPLRDRKSDIPLLAEHFLQKNLTKAQRVISGFSDTALDFLRNHPWPGNVRELNSAIIRAIILGKGDYLEESDFGLLAEESYTFDLERARRSLKDVEREHILLVLEALDWKKTAAASILGMDRKTLGTKCKEYDLVKGGLK